MDMLLPLTYEESSIQSTATKGADSTKPDASLMLGAVELNLNSLADLVQQTIQIRGDPYWLGRPKGYELATRSANYTKGGVNYSNTTPSSNYDTGLMDIAEQDYGIIGVYRVGRVNAQYADGQFTQALDSFRDMNTNVAYIYELLNSNKIEKEEKKRKYIKIKKRRNRR